MQTNIELLNSLNAVVYGHTAAKKALISVIKRSRLRYEQIRDGVDKSDAIETSSILLVGESGTGKTHLIRTLCAICEIPVLCIDGSQLTPSGNDDGLNLQQLTAKIHKFAAGFPSTEKCPSTKSVLEQLVVYVDEFDKVSAAVDGSSTGGWKRNAQDSFLKIIENSGDFESITWVFSGAFSFVKEEKKGNSIGFFQEDTKEEERDIYQIAMQHYGLIPELLGRIRIICELDTLTEDDYKKIVDTHLLPKKMQELKRLGCENVFVADEDIYGMIKRAVKSKQGVRSLKRELDVLLLDYEFNFESTHRHIAKVEAAQARLLTQDELDEFNYGMRKYNGR